MGIVTSGGTSWVLGVETGLSIGPGEVMSGGTIATFTSASAALAGASSATLAVPHV